MLHKVFNEHGNGVILRGTPVKEDKKDRQPHLTEEQAYNLLKESLSEYYNAIKIFPQRLVIHKSSNYSEEEINKLKEIISERISDIDGNGENSVLLSTLVFADNAGSEEYDYAIQTKLDLTFTDDCSFIYLMDKANVDAQMQKEVVDQIYDCTDSFIDSSSDKVVKAADGKGYAVNLKDSRLLKDNGIYCDDLYILIRRNYKDDEKKYSSTR